MKKLIEYIEDKIDLIPHVIAPYQAELDRIRRRVEARKLLKEEEKKDVDKFRPIIESKGIEDDRTKPR